MRRCTLKEENNFYFKGSLKYEFIGNLTAKQFTETILVYQLNFIPMCRFYN